MTGMQQQPVEPCHHGRDQQGERYRQPASGCEPYFGNQPEQRYAEQQPTAGCREQRRKYAGVTQIDTSRHSASPSRVSSHGIPIYWTVTLITK